MEEEKEVGVMTDTEVTVAKKETQTWRFGKKEKALTLICSLVFIVMGVLAYIIALNNEEQTLAIYKKVSGVMLENVDVENNSITELAKDKPSDNLWQMQLSDGWHIFLNNLRAIAVVVLGGILTVYFYPTFALAVNGAVMGVFLAAFELMNPADSVWATLLTGIVPHGIFEIPAIILAAVVGSRFGLATYRKILKKELLVPYRTEWKRLVMYFFVVLLPLLVAAAYIEAFVTPYIMLGSAVIQTIYVATIVLLGCVTLLVRHTHRKTQKQLDRIEAKIDATQQQNKE